MGNTKKYYILELHTDRDLKTNRKICKTKPKKKTPPLTTRKKVLQVIMPI